MDTLTLRVTFGVVALCVLVLCYGVTYRSTRAAFSGWWCLSLAAFIGAALLFALNGTDAQFLANPSGNALGVLGAAFVWAGAASLRGRRQPAWLLVAPPVAVFVLSALDQPESDVWAGGTAYLAAMSVLIGLSAGELVQTLRAERRRAVERSAYRFAIASMVAASATVGGYYGLRAVAFVVVGPDARLFVVAFGAQATTLLTLVLLVVVTFSMSALSHEQQAAELREQATRDGMTGLLNRTEFLRRAQAAIDDGPAGRRGAVVVADLDRFKELNDGYGHDAGDEAILVFAEVCRQTIGDHGIIGRLGGDEFVVLLHDGGRAEQVTEEIAVRLAAAPATVPMPSASFGVAGVGQGCDIGTVVTQADVALYQAKAAGRACAVRYDGRLPTPVQTYGRARSATS